MSQTRRSLSLSAGVFLSLALLAAGCAPNGGTPEAANPLWEPGEQRDKIVVISDLHLGIDDELTETLKNLEPLKDFLKRVEDTKDVRELVIAGDFLDEWYLPVYYPAYTDQDQFYRDVIANNQGIFDQLNAIAESGIKLVYVPGNHDLTLTAEVLQEALPTVEQARDVQGLGTYRTGERNEIVIEHGHRYDVFSAPDTVTNAHLCDSDETIFPAGYFYARYAATWVLEGKPAVAKDLPLVTKAPDPSDPDQYGAYIYYKILENSSTKMTPTEGLDEPIFDMHFAGLCGNYTYLDFFPTEQPDGTISAPVLFQNVQRTWEERQQLNKVAVPNTFVEAAAGTVDWKYFMAQAQLQYLNNPNDPAELVVFGHTHVPTLQVLDAGTQYVNSGTWVDDNTDSEDGSRVFVVISDGEQNTAVLYTYGVDGALTDLGAGTTE